FLGYTIGRCYSPKTGRSYLGTYPSDKKVRKMVATIRILTARKTTGRDPEELVGQLNRKIVGWANYFHLGPVSAAYDIVNRHVCQRLRRWLCRKYRVVGAGLKRFSDPYLRDTLGLVDLRQHRRKLLCANA
ncbi:MAG: group II intron reverse transcriptase/maturase, partial [Bradyrhizobium sp.]|nr:group II intron reverse transcriptase/maturase [Bradyrhizobium sp.]